jgi:hypothetical protein
MRQQRVQKQPKPHGAREEGFAGFETQLAEEGEGQAALHYDEEYYGCCEEAV